MLRRIKQLFCAHEVDISDLVTVVNANNVTVVRAHCRKCDCLLEAPCGLALKAKLVNDKALEKAYVRRIQEGPKLFKSATSTSARAVARPNTGSSSVSPTRPSSSSASTSQATSPAVSGTEGMYSSHGLPLAAISSKAEKSWADSYMPTSHCQTTSNSESSSSSDSGSSDCGSTDSGSY